MTKTFKAAALAATALVSALGVSSPVLAQARPAVAPIRAPVVVSADVDQAVQGTTAFQTAVNQMQTTYAPQLANRNTRATALQTEMDRLVAVATAEQTRLRGLNQQSSPALNAAVNAINQHRTAAQAELQQLSQPIELAVAYVREQITLKLSDAVRSVTTARGADILVNNEAVIWRSEGADVTSAITTELNRLVPSAQIVPPQGYEPGALLRAQQAALAPAAPGTPAPAAQPQSR